MRYECLNNIERTKESPDGLWSFDFAGLRQSLRIAVRSLRRAPARGLGQEQPTTARLSTSGPPVAIQLRADLEAERRRVIGEIMAIEVALGRLSSRPYYSSVPVAAGVLQCVSGIQEPCSVIEADIHVRFTFAPLYECRFAAAPDVDPTHDTL